MQRTVGLLAAISIAAILPAQQKAPELRNSHSAS